MVVPVFEGATLSPSQSRTNLVNPIKSWLLCTLSATKLGAQLFLLRQLKAMELHLVSHHYSQKEIAFIRRSVHFSACSAASKDTPPSELQVMSSTHMSVIILLSSTLYLTESVLRKKSFVLETSQLVVKPHFCWTPYKLNWGRNIRGWISSIYWATVHPFWFRLFRHRFRWLISRFTKLEYIGPI